MFIGFHEVLDEEAGSDSSIVCFLTECVWTSLVQQRLLHRGEFLGGTAFGDPLSDTLRNLKPKLQPETCLAPKLQPPTEKQYS